MSEHLAFDRNARYGAALIGVAFAAYLCISTDFNAFIQASNYAGALGTDVPLVDFVEFVLIYLLFVGSFVLIPASGARRLAAVTTTSVALFLWAVIGIERGVGNIDQPEALWTVLTNQGFVTLLVALTGWLLVRARHPLAFVVVLLAFIPPVISRILIDRAFTSGAYTLIIEGTVIALGLGGVWLAVWIDRLVRGRGTARSRSTPAADAAPGR
ncbi:hypothetical protein ACFM35_12160 [Microbacterium sp. P01]|uniref:hypothetical protein n=1 Tax=unclassified Microbacterium TaxID=2609290 RepID=UPI00366F2B82